MHLSRKLILTSTLAICGAVYAAAPLAQGPAQPTDHHQRIVKGAGHWEGTMSMHMPGMPEPMTSDCAEEVSALGDLWTTSHFQTNFMGMPFAGASTLGYDVKKGKYVGTWIDSMTTTLTVMEGHFDEAKNAIVMDYEMEDEMGDMKHMRSYTMCADDSYTCNFFIVEDGEEAPQMEIAMKRKGATREASAAK